MDPFMGGGTSIIEGLGLGRKMVGVDINALAHFVTEVRTTPLTDSDKLAIRKWAASAARNARRECEPIPTVVKNMPPAVCNFVSGLLKKSDRLKGKRRRTFARCVLLRLGQWALDGREESSLRRATLIERLPALTELMLGGMDEFVTKCGDVGLTKRDILRSRRLIFGSSVGIDRNPLFSRGKIKPSLVFTSPPYPQVHVLYHRWQYRGRRETAAPYWIAQVDDGYFESHYTGGSRSPSGERKYFQMITDVFKSVHGLLRPDALVVQLLGFADAASQLPMYLAAMKDAGYSYCKPPENVAALLRRSVPNRKWYARVQESTIAPSEYLLVHRPG